MDDELLNLLRDLIAIPSVNPETTDDASIAGEQRIAEFVSEYLRGLGFEIEWEGAGNGRPNVVASYGPAQPSRTLVVEAHLDTVGVRKMKRPPFEAQMEDGKMYGRGACDDKGPLAAALWALKRTNLPALAEAGWRILFVGAMGEEIGNRGADRLVAWGLRADEAIILEPTEHQIIHTHKGAFWYKITVHGRAAHGSEPERGVNAILGMEHVLAMLKEQVSEDQVRFPDHPLGKPTLSIGVIKGGESLNIVAADCMIEVDRRTLPEEDNEDILRRVREGLEELRKQGAFVSFDIEIIKSAEAFCTAPGSGLVDRLKKSCDAVGISSKKAGAAWYSDAGPLSKVCGDVVVFGPGSIKQAHTNEEYIDVEALRAGSDIFTSFFELTSQKEAGE